MSCLDEIINILYRLFIESPWSSFLSNSLSKNKNFFTDASNFFLLAEYFLMSYASCLQWSFSIFSLLWILKIVLKHSPARDLRSICSGAKPYLVLFIRFKLSIILVGLIFSFWAFNLAILVLSSFIFCSPANASSNRRCKHFYILQVFNPNLLKFIIDLEPHSSYFSSSLFLTSL